MKICKTIKIILLASLCLTFARSAEVGIFPHETKKIEIHDLGSFRFPIDQSYVDKLAKCKVEQFDAPLFSLGRAPLLLIVDDKAEEKNKYQLYCYVVVNNTANIMEMEFTNVNGTISNITYKHGFEAKKMPILRFGEANIQPVRK